MVLEVSVWCLPPTRSRTGVDAVSAIEVTDPAVDVDTPDTEPPAEDTAAVDDPLPPNTAQDNQHQRSKHVAPKVVTFSHKIPTYAIIHCTPLPSAYFCIPSS